MAKTVDTRHAEYEAMLPRWERCGDVAEGTHALWAKTTTYLPMLTDETSAAYTSRLHRTVLYNATWRTIVGFLGLLFRKPAVIEVPSLVESMMEDVTLTGVSLRLFAAEVSESLLVYGRVAIWVNYPEVPAGNTRADALEMSVRPSLTKYGAKSLINWQTARVANSTRLSMVVLEEELAVPDGEFATKEQLQYRVLDLENGRYRVRVFQVHTAATGEKHDVLVEGPFYPVMNNQHLDYIPFYIISPDDTTPEVDVPPFIDLVDVNIAHYQVTSDYEHGCHWSGIPTVIITGHEMRPGETITVGGGAAIVLPQAAARAEMLEVGTGGFTALEKNLDRKEAQMVVLGARLLEVQKPGIEAAETALIHRSGEQSILASMAQTTSTGITEALKTFVAWAGGEGPVRFELNRDFFHSPMSAEMLTAFVSSWQSKAVSFETMFENLRKGEIYPPGATAEEERARIESVPDPIFTKPLTAQ